MFYTVLITFLAVIDGVMIAVILASRATILAKLLWILAILCLPIVGPVFYFLYGDPTPTR
ncbi:MAG: PLDc N-terminal domain-containing protein [Candidatus Sumerlaeota bacterium]